MTNDQRRLFGSEEPINNSAPDIVIVLPGFSRINIERRSSTPIVARLKSKSKAVKFPRPAHVKSDPTLHYAGGLDSVPGVRAIKDQVLACLKTANTAAKTHPWRNCQVGQEINSRSRRYEN